MEAKELIDWLNFCVNADTLINTKGARGVLTPIRDRLVAAERMAEALEKIKEELGTTPSSGIKFGWKMLGFLSDEDLINYNTAASVCVLYARQALKQWEGLK